MSDPAPAGIERWCLRFHIFLFFALLALAGSAALGGGLFLGWARLNDAGRAAAARALIVGAVLRASGLAAVTLWVWLSLHNNVARLIERLAKELRARPDRRRFAHRNRRQSAGWERWRPQPPTRPPRFMTRAARWDPRWRRKPRR
jgi:hypothetical protein